MARLNTKRTRGVETDGLTPVQIRDRSANRPGANPTSSLGRASLSRCSEEATGSKGLDTQTAVGSPVVSSTQQYNGGGYQGKQLSGTDTRSVRDDIEMGAQLILVNRLTSAPGFPRDERGQTVSATRPSCWRRVGKVVGGRTIRLESVLTPAGWASSVPAVHRFFERLTIAADGDGLLARTPARRRREAKSASDRLIAEGV